MLFYLSLSVTSKRHEKRLLEPRKIGGVLICLASSNLKSARTRPELPRPGGSIFLRGIRRRAGGRRGFSRLWIWPRGSCNLSRPVLRTTEFPRSFWGQLLRSRRRRLLPCSRRLDWKTGSWSQSWRTTSSASERGRAAPIGRAPRRSTPSSRPVRRSAARDPGSRPPPPRVQRGVHARLHRHRPPTPRSLRRRRGQQLANRLRRRGRTAAAQLLVHGTELRGERRPAFAV